MDQKMKRRVSKKRQVIAANAADRISSLPEDIKQHILTFLPLREAAKASLLSTKWRKMWTHIPSLVFDETFHPTVQDELMAKFCTVLMLHSAPLRELTLSLPVLRRYPDRVHRILMFLETKEHEINSLTITVGHQHLKPRQPIDEVDQDYKLPKLLFSKFFSSRLKTLRLTRCEIVSSSSSSSSSSPTSCFDGFSVLNVLELRNVVFQEHDTSAPWRFRCPLLSSLSLVNCGGFFEEPDFVIEAPKLSRLKFDGKFSSLHLKHTPLLETVILHKQAFGEDKKVDPSKLSLLWAGLAAVESLYVSGDLYPYLARGYKAIGDHGQRLEMLKHLTLDEVCMSKRSDVWSALCLITKSSNLQRLSISMEMKRRQMNDDIVSAELNRLLNGELEVGEFRGMFASRNGTSKYDVSSALKEAEVKSFHGRKHEMSFVRWLLSSSPALEKMEIQLSTTLLVIDEKSILRELNGFKRPSNNTQVMIN